MIRQLKLSLIFSVVGIALLGTLLMGVQTLDADDADGSAAATEQDPLDGLKCFIMKKKDVKGKKGPKVMDYNGGKLYLCCKSCIRRVEKKPEKYEAKANHQMVYTGQFVQELCPLSGEKIGADAPTLDIQGVEAKFANQAELDKVKDLDVDEQIEKVFGKDGFKVGKFKLVKVGV